MLVLTAIWVMAGVIFVMFLPGYAWSSACFPRGSLSVLERVVYSIAISISLVSAVFFFANRFLAVKIDLLSSSAILSAITVSGFIYAWCRRRSSHGELVRRRSGRLFPARGRGAVEK